MNNSALGKANSSALRWDMRANSEFHHLNNQSPPQRNTRNEILNWAGANKSVNMQSGDDYFKSARVSNAPDASDRSQMKSSVDKY